MNRTVKRVAAVVGPVAALVLLAGGTAAADSDDFLNSKIASTDSGYQNATAGDHGAQSTGAGTHTSLVQTGNWDDEDDD
ncbi:hypothetical protein C3486_05755 [Streptomyces sp. Ru73]|uniref:hypothetical protein n=1 Tax=Streptomyces sp. Ru73 TaxID=2080748 RepID=UPI000CDE1883|nr:hypothetical protein [Streptomyces sp. Ru73]POX42241.1 hypothetical protein C3486_05755 [Streptomyces sp. Ru73]